MSQRRMTSLDVINTDAFLDMPASSQLLYFHLNARADDDGFVSNPKSIMRNCGSQGDDLKLLIIKKFIISFDDGVCVIKHWRINNYVRKDIYKETKYLDHKQTLFIRSNGAYTLTNDNRAIPVPSGHFQLEDIPPKKLENPTCTERALSIGKDSIDKTSELRNSHDSSKSSDSEKETATPLQSFKDFLLFKGYEEHEACSADNEPIFYWAKGNRKLSTSQLQTLEREYNKAIGLKPELPKNEVNDLFSLFKFNPAFLSWRKNTTQRSAANSLLDMMNLEEIKKHVAYSQQIKNKPFAPQINSPYDLLNKLNQLKNFKEKPEKEKSLAEMIRI